jgi:hypothetical protein
MADKPVLTTTAGNPGYPAPSSYTQYSKLSVIKKSEDVPAAEQTIADLVKGQEAVVRTARKVFPTAEKAAGEPTTDLLTQRMQTREKTARFGAGAETVKACKSVVALGFYCSQALLQHPVMLARQSAEKFPMRALGLYLLVIPTVSMASTAQAAEMYNVTGPADAANKVSCNDVIKLATGSWQANAMFTDPSHKVTVNPVFGDPAEIEILDKRCGKQPESEKH